jgi:hypothetical protein
MLTFKQYLEEQTKLSGALGSNEGGVYQDEDGSKHYKKVYRNGDQAKVEALTGKLYSKLGVKNFNPEYKNENGKHIITTKWDDDVRPSKPSDYKHISKDQADQLAKMYHAGVLTKNWDIVGLVHDNVMKNKKTGDYSSIDHGGAFHFRAQGGHKDYTPDIDEHKSLMDPSRAAGHVFGEVNKQHPNAFKDNIHTVKNLKDDEIHHIFKNSGLKNWEELHHNFNERKKKLIAKYDGDKK